MRLCNIPWCDRPHYGKGFCSLHWQRNRKGLSMDAPVGYIPIGPRNLPIGSSKEKDGYILEKTLSGWDLQHRLVMERHLGRLLASEETVHHKNGVGTDNKLTNLELWSSNHPKGQRVTDLLEWADEIIELYRGPDR